MAIPVSLEIVQQKYEWDCAVAAFAMLTGISYSDGWSRMYHNNRDRLQGISSLQFIRRAKVAEQVYLRRPLSRLEEAIDGHVDAICGVIYAKKEQDLHVVVLFHGVIVDPATGQLWEPSTYLARFPADTFLELTA